MPDMHQSSPPNLHGCKSVLPEPSVSAPENACTRAYILHARDTTQAASDAFKAQVRSSGQNPSVTPVSLPAKTQVLKMARRPPHWLNPFPALPRLTRL